MGVPLMVTTASSSGPVGEGKRGTPSSDRTRATSVLPDSVPWLQTVTWALTASWGRALAGPSTERTTKSGWYPIPIGAETWVSLLGSTSGPPHWVTRCALRRQVPSPWGGDTGAVRRG